MSDFIIESLPEAAPNADAGGFVIESLPQPVSAAAAAPPPTSADAFDMARDVAWQGPQGFNRGLDAVLNAPYNLTRAAAGVVGVELPEAQSYISDTFNSGRQAETAAGRVAETAGEVVGSSVPLAVAPFAMAMRAPATVAPSAAVGAPILAPTGTARAVGHEILQTIRANPMAAAQMEAASAAGSGVATGATREAGGGPIAETIAGLAGGFAPALIPAARGFLRPQMADVNTAEPQVAPAAAEEASPRVMTPEKAQKPPVDSYAAPVAGKVVTPDGSMEIDATPQVVELSDLKLAQGGLQPRDRSRDEYIQEARERATRLDPEQLRPGRVSDSGPPIVQEDGTIVSGNGRALSISAVYRDPNLAAQRDAYRASLPPEAQNMREPVLVMRSSLQGPDAERFAAASNTPRAARMSATERAGADAKAMGDDFKLYRGGEFDAPQNIDFMRSFMAKAVPPAERTSMSKDGRLTKEGIDRMRSAVLASAFDDSDMLSRMLESADDNIRGLTGAMTDAAPAFAGLRSDVAAGNVLPGLDPTSNIGEAVKFISDLRRRGITPQQHFAQADAFGGLVPGVEKWVRALYSDDLTTQLSRPQISAMMRAYAEEAGKHAPGGMFPDLTTGADVLKVARKAIGSAGADVQPSAPRGDAMPDGRPLPPPEGVLVPHGAAPVALPPTMGPNPAKRGALPSYLTRDSDAVLKPTRDDVAAASLRSEIPVSRAVASDSRFTKRTAGALADAWLIGGPIEHAANKTVEALQAAARNVLKEFGSGNRFNAGEVASVALREWLAVGSKDTVGEVYKRVATLFDKKLSAPLAKTRKIADDLKREMAESTSKSNLKALELVEDALNKPGGLSYEGLLKLREDVGARFDGSMIPEPGTPTPALKRLYGGLSEDLHGLVFRSGGEKALRSYLRAERVNQLTAQKRDEIGRIVGEVKDKAVAPEKVAQRIVEMASSKSSADVRALLEVRKVAGTGAFDEIASFAVSRMGFEKDGNFSPAKFFSQYADMTENGRRVLFGSTGKGELKQALDDIATIAARAREIDRFRNASKTFSNASAPLAVVGVIMHPLTLGGTVLGGRMLAAALAKPVAAKGVSRWASAYVNLAANPGRNAQLNYSLASRTLSHLLAEELGEDEDAINQHLLAAGAQ